MLSTLMMTMTIMMTLTKHPMSMGLILLTQSTLIAMKTSTISYSPWYSYILFIIMVGSMMVLFIYMTSVASNIKFKMKTWIMMIPLLTMLIFMSNNKFFNNLMDNNFNLSMYENNQSFKLSLTKFINLPTNLIFLMMMMYLLITMIAVIKITNSKMGPLRQS